MKLLFKKIQLIFLFLLVASLHTNAQQIDPAFITAFSSALNKKFSEKQLDKMFSDFSSLLTPQSDITQLTGWIKGEEISAFPLYEFRNDKLYYDNIDRLLASKNSNQRLLAYLVIASAGDITRENILLKQLETERLRGNRIWAGMGLMYLHCDRTTPLFDFLVRDEDFGDAHMLPLYFKLNKDSLQQTAYARIHSKDVKAQVLAAQLLSVTTLNTKTEELLKEAVKNWDINIKGYAIYSMKELQMGDLLPVLEPLLDKPETKRIALGALANSPTKTDHDHLLSLVNKKDTVSKDLLDCLYGSKSPENVKLWLDLLSQKPLPEHYYFFVREQPLIASDTLLPFVQNALQKIKDKECLGELVRALEGRTDDTSVKIMIALLKHPEVSVRYWTANTLQKNDSPLVQDPAVQQLIKDGLRDGN
ncbi:MAG TPA: hypothetical protein VI112_11050 [Bacteroidia bacterium]